MAVSLRRVAPWLLGALSTALAPAAVSAQTEVNAFEPSFTENGVWFENVLASGATAEIVDLTGEGGDLENNQPLPTGAARLTTDFDNDDQADVAVRDDYGLAGEVLPSLTLEYSWHKASNSGQNLFAAPAIRLAIYAEDCSDSDCFGTFIYEPYWQPDGSVHTPPLDQWVTEAIDADTGVWWWTGGFGKSSDGGDLRTFNEWLAEFGPDFDAAAVFQVSIGVGSYNQGQIGYFDGVQIAHSFDVGYAEAYDFEVLPDEDGDGVADADDNCAMSDTDDPVDVNGTDTDPEVDNREIETAVPFLADSGPGCFLQDLVDQAVAEAGDPAELVDNILDLGIFLDREDEISPSENFSLRVVSARAGFGP